MALPLNTLAPIEQKFPFSYNLDITSNLLVRYEMGGVGINDPSQGHLVQMWKLETKYYREFWLSAPNFPETLILNTGLGASSVSFTFDSNMQPVITWVSMGQTYLYWYDSAAESFVITNFGADIKWPQVSLDDKRDLSVTTGVSDVIFAYARGNKLFYRQQRDRYLIERELKSGVQGELLQIGMNTQNRFQFVFGIRISDEEFWERYGISSDPVTNLGPKQIAEVGTYKPTATVWKPGD